MKHQTTSLDTIECPHCHKSFPITEALQHQFIEPLKNELKKETLEKEQSLTQLAEVLKEREAEIAQEKDGIEKQIAARVQETTAQLKQEVRKETEATVALELKDMRAQLNEKTQKIDEFQKTELALRKRERELEERANAQDLEVERKLDTARKTIAAETTQRVTEEYRLKEQEWEKVIRDLRNQMDDLKRTAEQGSQQTQGEVLELELEQFLATTFPHDDIKPVPKGKRGADVVHTVYTPTGYCCGTIIWESKRTKSSPRPFIRPGRFTCVTVPAT